MLIPDFIEVQRNSFHRFLKQGLIDEIQTRNNISTEQGDAEVIFFPQYYKLHPPDSTCKEAIIRAKTYAGKLYLPAQLVNHKTKEIKMQWILLGNIPIMTKRGHFIINGSPRIIINQMTRSPGIYYQEKIDENKKRIYYADLISYRGTWLRFQIDKKKKIWARMKKTPKISILVFLQAWGISIEEIFDSIKNSEYLENSFLRENHPQDRETALITMYSQTHPKKDKILIKPFMGKIFLQRKFQNPLTYTLSKLGRKKLNEKLGLFEETTLLTSQDLISAIEYLIQFEYGSGELDDIDNLKNRRVRASGEILQNQFSLGFFRLEKTIREKLQKNRKKLTLKGLISTKPINGALKEFFGSSQLSQFMDQTNPLAEITHKRRITSIGPGGVSRETAGMAIRGIHPTHYGRICPIETPEGPNAGLVNSITIFGQINKEGFLETPFYPVYKGQVQTCCSPNYFTAEEEEIYTIAPSDIYLSKLSLLPNKKIPTRLRKDFKQLSKINIECQAISQLQMISIATSLIPFLEHDDANRALMGSNMQRQAVPLMKAERPIIGTGLEARVIADSGHCVEAPFDGYISYIGGGHIILSSLQKNGEKRFSDEKFFSNSKSSFKNFYFSSFFFLSSPKNKNFLRKEKYLTTLPFLSSKLSGFIPSIFLQNESSIKKTENKQKSPIFFENQNINSVRTCLSKKSRITETTIVLDTYHRSNQETCLTHRPRIEEGNWVQKGDILADGTASVGGELALGKNIIIAYMPWEGYNFEDAVLISERLVYDDLYTSLHIERFEIEIRDTQLGLEQITKNIPDVNNDEIAHLNELGIAEIGSLVEEGAILVGKVTPIAKKALSPHEKLMYDVLGKEIPTTRDTSLRVPKGVHGRVIHIEILETQTLPAETFFDGPGRVHIYVAEKRKIQVGDKIAGRHGNKGIISKILPRQDMPYLPDGTAVDIILNPLGVPSRMNVGQVFECLLGLAGSHLHEQYKIIPFDETFGPETSRSLVYSKLYTASQKTKQDWLFNPNYPGKIKLFNGSTGNSFHQYITVGQAYILKLVHLVDEKIHARSTGPYSLVTQQPLRGRSKHGGQRLGEMEVWALEGFGAAYTLQELLTIKSDDMNGRHHVIDCILKNKSIVFGTPESFKVLIRELQSLCLDARIYGYTKENNNKKKEIDVLKLG